MLNDATPRYPWHLRRGKRHHAHMANVAVVLRSWSSCIISRHASQTLSQKFSDTIPRFAHHVYRCDHAIWTWLAFSGLVIHNSTPFSFLPLSCAHAGSLFRNFKQLHRHLVANSADRLWVRTMPTVWDSASVPVEQQRTAAPLFPGPSSTNTNSPLGYSGYCGIHTVIILSVVSNT